MVARPRVQGIAAVLGFVDLMSLSLQRAAEQKSGNVIIIGYENVHRSCGVGDFLKCAESVSFLQSSTFLVGTRRRERFGEGPDEAARS